MKASSSEAGNCSARSAGFGIAIATFAYQRSSRSGCRSQRRKLLYSFDSSSEAHKEWKKLPLVSPLGVVTEIPLPVEIAISFPPAEVVGTSAFHDSRAYSWRGGGLVLQQESASPLASPLVRVA